MQRDTVLTLSTEALASTESTISPAPATVTKEKGVKQRSITVCWIRAKMAVLAGTCFDRFGGFVCQCVGGFSGNECQLEMSSRMLGDDPSVSSGPAAQESCEPETCQNGGICSSNLNSGIECLCLPGFTGPRCQTEANDCLNVTCPAHSQCVDTPGVETHECVCLSGFTGIASDGCVDIDDCQSNPCRNNGTCTDLVNGFQCTCTGTGFGGIDCSQEINECDEPSPCLNGVDGIGNYTCLCPPGFEGRDCQTDVDECQLPTTLCGIHSTTCTDLVGDYRCVCEPGWSGRHCDADIDECADSVVYFGSFYICDINLIHR